MVSGSLLGLCLLLGLGLVGLEEAIGLATSFIWLLTPIQSFISCISCSSKRKREKHAPKLLEKMVKASNGQIKVLVADFQYSSRRLRKNIFNSGITPIILYPSNQKPVDAEFLRVDKRFRTYGTERLKRLYAYKASAERVISRLKQHLSLENHKVRGLRNTLTHALLCIITMLLIALTAIKHGKPDKIRTITNLT